MGSSFTTSNFWISFFSIFGDIFSTFYGSTFSITGGGIVFLVVVSLRFTLSGEMSSLGASFFKSFSGSLRLVINFYGFFSTTFSVFCSTITLSANEVSQEVPSSI